MSLDQFDPYRDWLGIQPHEHPVNHYRILGVARFESNIDLISSAADERMAMIRKFQTGPRGPHTQRILNELSTARGCLSNPQEKANYDAQLNAAIHAAQMHVAQLQVSQLQAAQLAAAQLQVAQLQAAQLQAAQHQAAPPPVAPPSVVSPTSYSATPTSRQEYSSSSHADDGEDYQPAVSGNTTWLIITLACVMGVVMIGCAAYVAISKGRTKKLRVVKVADEIEVNPAEPVLVVPIENQSPDQEQDRTSIMQEANGHVVLPVSVVKLEGKSIQLVREGDEDVINQWTSAEDNAQWDFQLVKPGFFRVEIQYGATGDAVGSEFAVEVGDKKANFEVLDSGAFTLYKSDYRVIAITRSGVHTLTVRPQKLNGSQLMVLKSIELVPVQR
ncbi:MAG: hypothetical protein ACI9G1_003571 [Pirellulaceae bacterium]|jgi:hypothetical protein